ncbi:MAG: hypothetical protein KY475_17995 [Planctomycetes bacterium]|nr:hypothetical protein [Planctomycetota bacterium]
MNEFIELRKRAREKRDKAIDQARKEYNETLVRIAALEQDLLGKEVSSHKRISACIDRVIPSDRPFTTVDIMTALEALDGGRAWRKRSVDHHIYRLRERGLLRRLRKSRKTEPAVYVRIGVKVEESPFQGMTLREVMRATLAERPMNATELAVAMLDAGYETMQSPQAFRNAVRNELRNPKGGFRKRGDKWEA